YDLATGTDAVVGSAPVVGPIAGQQDRRLVAWGAVSPDGQRIAVMAPRDPQRAIEAGRGVAGTMAIYVADVTSGRVTRAPGFEMRLPQATLAFSADSRWLLAAAPTSGGAELVAYDCDDTTETASGEPADLAGPYDVADL